MYPILKAEKLADKIYLMEVKAPRVATEKRERSPSYSRPLELLLRRCPTYRPEIPSTISWAP